MTTHSEQLEWHRVADLDELPEGRVKTVTTGTHSMALTHIDGQPLSPPGRAPWRGLHRDRREWTMLAPMPLARLGLRSENGTAAGRPRGLGAADLPAGGSRGRHLCGARSRTVAPDDSDGRDGGNHDELGRYHSIRDGRPFEPGAGRCPTAAGETGAPRVLRHPPRRRSGVRVFRLREVYQANPPRA